MFKCGASIRLYLVVALDWMRPVEPVPPPLGPLGVIGFPVCDYCLSLFHGAVRYRRYRYVTVQHGHRHLHGDPITATGGWKLLKYV